MFIESKMACKCPHVKACNKDSGKQWNCKRVWDVVYVFENTNRHEHVNYWADIFSQVEKLSETHGPIVKIIIAGNGKNSGYDSKEYLYKVVRADKLWQLTSKDMALFNLPLPIYQRDDEDEDIVDDTIVADAPAEVKTYVEPAPDVCKGAYISHILKRLAAGELSLDDMPIFKNFLSTPPLRADMLEKMKEADRLADKGMLAEAYKLRDDVRRGQF